MFVETSMISSSGGFRDDVVESMWFFLLSDMILLLRQSLYDCALYCFQICFHVLPIVTCSAIFQGDPSRLVYRSNRHCLQEQQGAL